MNKVFPKKAILGYTKKGAPIIDVDTFVSFLIEEAKEEGENPSPEEVRASVIDIILSVGQGMKKSKKPILVNKEPEGLPKPDHFTIFVAKQMEENFLKTLFITHKGIPEC